MTIIAPRQAAKTVHRQGRTKRRSDDKGAKAGGEADAQRQKNDAAQLGIEVNDQSRRRIERVGKVLHRPLNSPRPRKSAKWQKAR